MLTDHRFIVYLFAARTGTVSRDAHDQLMAIWRACVSDLGLDQPFARLASDPPDPRISDLAGGPITFKSTTAATAARRGGGVGLREMWWDIDHDVSCLSLTLAGDGEPDTTWSSLHHQWQCATGHLPVDALIGIAYLYTALTPSPDESLASEIEAALPVGVVEAPGWEYSGITTHDQLTVWDLTPPGSVGLLRRVVITTSVDADRQLGDWVWRRGLAPMARYLLNAAKLRYQARTLHGELGALRRHRNQTAAVLARLRPMLTDAHTADVDTLYEAQQQLAELQAGEAGLIDAVISIGAMRRTVAISAANMTALANATLGSSHYRMAQDPSARREYPSAEKHVPGGPAGIFAHDYALAESLDSDLDDVATYLDADGKRAQYYGGIAERELTRRQHLDTESRRQRQERFTLLQTAILGATVMALTAVQAFDYTIPLPAKTQPAAITILGALAFWLSTIALAHIGPARHTLGRVRLQAAVQAAALAAFAASLTWTFITFTALDSVVTRVLCLIAFTLTAIASLTVRLVVRRMPG